MNLQANLDISRTDCVLHLVFGYSTVLKHRS